MCKNMAFVFKQLILSAVMHMHEHTVLLFPPWRAHSCKRLPSVFPLEECEDQGSGVMKSSLQPSSGTWCSKF